MSYLNSINELKILNAVNPIAKIENKLLPFFH